MDHVRFTLNKQAMSNKVHTLLDMPTPGVYRLTNLDVQGGPIQNQPRHATLVRVTHWITTFSFVALLVSGVAILMAHPRLYWGETGAFGTPALIELPIPLNTDQSGWGRSLHFLAAWIIVLNGMVYMLFGFLTGHFRSNMMPARSDWAWRSFAHQISPYSHWQRPDRYESETYNVLQRLAYLVVVFVLFPLMIGTGLAMSPAVMAVLPAMVALFGGHQSARTIHFVVMDFLILFLVVHVAMVCVAGFRQRVGAMVIDRGTAEL